MIVAIIIICVLIVVNGFLFSEVFHLRYKIKVMEEKISNDFEWYNNMVKKHYSRFKQPKNK